MPRLIMHIDYIARQKQRDVLLLTFYDGWMDFPRQDKRKPWIKEFEKKKHPRSKIIKWLDKNNIKWEPCGDIASENGFASYRGQLYIDLPYNETDPVYKKLSYYLENRNGEIRKQFRKTKFWLLSLELAMKNAHHDEPEFWEKWAETF